MCHESISRVGCCLSAFRCRCWLITFSRFSPAATGDRDDCRAQAYVLLPVARRRYYAAGHLLCFACRHFSPMPWSTALPRRATWPAICRHAGASRFGHAAGRFAALDFRLVRTTNALSHAGWPSAGCAMPTGWPSKNSAAAGHRARSVTSPADLKFRRRY